MTEYEQGFSDAREAAAQIAADYYTGVIRCRRTGDVEHVRMHVEYKWSMAVAERIRAMRSGDQ